MYFCLNPHIDIVKGKNNYLIIDTKSCLFYSIDKKFYYILQRCKTGEQIENITNDTEFLLNKLSQLSSLGIGQINSHFENQPATTFKKNILNMVWLNVTNKCNYRCIHCYENASQEKTDESMTLDDYDKLLQLLCQHFSITCVQITGGEPLLKGEFFIEELLKIIKKYPIKLIEIYTNLSLLNNSFIDIFTKYNVSIATSFYSKDATIHDSITQIKGSQKLIIKNLEILKKNKIPFRIGIIIMKQNEKEKDFLREWLNKKFNLNEIKKYDIVRPIGRALNDKIINKHLFDQKYSINPTKFSKHNFSNYFYNKEFNSCWGNKICIKSNGDIYPCVMSKIKVGNIKNIIKTLTSKNSYRFLTKDKIKHCKTCEFRYLCDECRAIYAESKKQIYDKPFTCKIK